MPNMDHNQYLANELVALCDLFKRGIVSPSQLLTGAVDLAFQSNLFNEELSDENFTGTAIHEEST